MSAEPCLPSEELAAAEEELAAYADTARVAGVERPLDAEAPVLGILGFAAAAVTGAPPIEVPLPENALKPAAIELELAAADPLSLSAAADSVALPPLRPPRKPPELVPGIIVPPMQSPAVLKYDLSATYLNGKLDSSVVARAAPQSILLKAP